MISVLENMKTAKLLSKSDKDRQKSSWMVPPRPNVPRELEEAGQIAKDSYRKARASNTSEN